MDLVQLFPTLLDGFSIRWIRDCGKGSYRGSYNSGVDETGIFSGGDMGLVAEASAAKDSAEIKGFKLRSVIARI